MARALECFSLILDAELSHVLANKWNNEISDHSSVTVFAINTFVSIKQNS